VGFKLTTFSSVAECSAIVLCPQPNKSSVEDEGHGKEKVRHGSSSSDGESTWERGRSPKRRQFVISEKENNDQDGCDGLGEFGCKSGCENCKEFFLCIDCKKGWHDCSCYLKSSTTTSVPTAEVSMEQRLLNLETLYHNKVASMEKELVAEKQKRLDLEKRFQSDRTTSPDSKGSRRRRRSRQ
jgi:hypothetical protein